MPRVTVLPVSANNLLTSFSVYWSTYTSVLAHYSMGTSSVYDQPTNYQGN